MTYKKYEFTAYTEADLLAGGGNGSSIGKGRHIYSFRQPHGHHVHLGQ